MFTGVIIHFGSGLNLRSECGTGDVEAVDSRVIFLAFEEDVFEIEWGFVAWSGIVISEAYGWSMLIMVWPVDRIPKPMDFICICGGYKLFLLLGFY